MIHMIAAATNTEEKAAELLSFTTIQESYLAETLAGTQAPSVYLAGNSSMLSTAGNAMYQSDMIRLAGGVNAAAEIEDTYWVEIDYEQLLTWNPDYIILASDAAYTAEDVLADPNLADCAAVVNGNVYQLPNKAEAWDSPVPSGILGALWLANVLHNDQVTDADCAAKIDEYYETFYNFTYSEN
jgi:iron complex transport system substrate-binding protein